MNTPVAEETVAKRIDEFADTRVTLTSATVNTRTLEPRNVDTAQ